MRTFFIFMLVAGMGLYHGLCTLTDNIVAAAPAVAMTAHVDRTTACMDDPMSDSCLSGHR